jgi:hypothetical protein
MIRYGLILYGQLTIVFQYAMNINQKLIRGSSTIPRMHQHTFVVAGNSTRSPEVRVQVLESVIGYYKTQSINEEDKLHLYQCIVDEIFKQLEYE